MKSDGPHLRPVRAIVIAADFQSHEGDYGRETANIAGLIFHKIEQK